MSLGFRRPPRREWLPMTVAVSLIGAGWLLLAVSDSHWGVAILLPGAVLFFGVLLYRMRTATEDN